MYCFRGYNSTLKQFIYGDGISQLKNNIQILSTSGEWSCDVDAATVGIRYVLDDSRKTVVYKGDVLHYRFTDPVATYSRYYEVCENETGAYCKEIWRDYDVNPDTFDITRFHNTKFKGDRKNLNWFNPHMDCKVVGNIWQNSELIQEEI